MRVLFITLALLVVSGCSTTSQIPDPSRTSEGVSTRETTATTETAEADDQTPSKTPVLARELLRAEVEMPAVKYLLDLAEEALNEENFERANALADRALKIERKTARAYLVLATVQDRQKNLQKANALAKQGLLYTSERSVVGIQLNKLVY